MKNDQDKGQDPVLDQTELEWIKEIQKGSDEAFSFLYKRYEGKVMGYLTHKIRNREIAEELFQVSWTKAVNHIHSYNSKSSFSSWLFTIVSNTAKDWFKKKNNQERLLKSLKDLPPESMDLQDSTNPSLNMDLSYLNQESKQVIELQYIEGLSSKEISKKLHLSESNVRKVSSRAKKQIRNFIIKGGVL